MRRFILMMLLLACPVIVQARGKVQGFCEQGAVTVSVPGGAGPSVKYYDQSLPGATVTVYIAGTLTLATIYSDDAGTAKANPFTCPAASTPAVLWSFYADDGRYDVKTSGTGVTTAFTQGDYQLIDADKPLNVRNACSPSFTGADMGAQIASAITNLPATGGTVDARCFQGAKAVAGNILNGLTVKPVTLLLGCVTITISDALIKGYPTGWNDLHLLGEGECTVIKTTVQRTFIQLGQASGVVISGISFQSVATGFAGSDYAIDSFDCTKCEISWNHFSGFGFGDVFMESTSGAQFASKNHIHHNWTTNTYGSNLLLSTYSQQNEIDSNICYSTHRNCIDLGGGRENLVHDNIVKNITGTNATDMNGILVVQAIGSGIMADSNEVYNNKVYNAKNACIAINGGDAGGLDYTKVHGNFCDTTVTDSGIAATTTTVGNAKGLEISGNTVLNAALNGIQADAFKDASIIGNLVMAPQRDCYRFQQSTNYTVEANTCVDSRASGAGTFGGYIFWGDAVGGTFIGNTERSPGTTPSFGVSFLQGCGTCGTMSGILSYGNHLEAALTTSGTVTFGVGSEVFIGPGSTGGMLGVFGLNTCGQTNSSLSLSLSNLTAVTGRRWDVQSCDDGSFKVIDHTGNATRISIDNAGTPTITGPLVIKDASTNPLADFFANGRMQLTGVTNVQVDLNNTTAVTGKKYSLQSLNAGAFNLSDGTVDVVRMSSAGLLPPTLLFANLGTPANGNVVYCSDCNIANPCTGAGTGAIAKRLNGAWVCN